MGPQSSLSLQPQDRWPGQQPQQAARRGRPSSPGHLCAVPGKVWLQDDSFPGPAARGLSMKRRGPPASPREL